MKNHKGNFAFLFLILLIFGLAVFLMRNPSTGADSYSYSDIYDLLMQEKVNSVTLRGTDLTLKLKQPDEDGNTTVTYQVAISLSISTTGASSKAMTTPLRRKRPGG